MPDARSDRHRLIRTPTRRRKSRRSTMGWDTVGIGRPMAGVENRRLETKCRQALIIQGLFYMVAGKELTAATPDLPMHETAGDDIEATEHYVGAGSDRLVGSDPDGGRNVSTGGRIALSGLPVYDQCVRGRDRYRGGSRLARIGRGGNGSWNCGASQVHSILVQEIHCDVSGRRASVEDIQCPIRTTGIGVIRGCADPNVRRSAPGTGRACGTRRALTRCNRQE